MYTKLSYLMFLTYYYILFVFDIVFKIQQFSQEQQLSHYFSYLTNIVIKCK